MHAVPKTIWPNNRPRTIRNGKGMVIMCEITYPPSSKGKPVDLYLSPEQVTELLLVLRDHAIEVRR